MPACLQRSRSYCYVWLQVALVDHEIRFTDAVQTARQLLRDGTLGEVPPQLVPTPSLPPPPLLTYYIMIDMM